MSRLRIPATAFLVIAFACAQAQEMQPGAVSVAVSGDGRYAASERAVLELKRHLEKGSARYVAPGQRLSIVLTGVQRAGRPSTRGLDDGMRVVDDTMPARIELEFTLLDSAGARVGGGSRSLRSPAFFTGTTGSNDTLRYEKALLDDWLRSEFGPKN